MSTVTQEKDYGHVPVLLHECLDALAIKPDGIYVDGQLGPGGIDMGHDGSDKFQVARLLFDLLYAGEACGVPARPGRNPG